MVRRILMKGNDAIGEAALRAGCKYYFGYPITPQSELLEYMAVNLPKRGGVFLQSESELAGISMVYGAAATGKRAMTSSSSPGISLMQECISYLASAELPAVIVNISRGGPGLGRITPAQSDYFQAVKGGGHGDYNMIVFTPASVQEMAECTSLAFTLADKYRTPVMILGDAFVGQMMESIDPTSLDSIEASPNKPWAVRGAAHGVRNLLLSAPFTNEELVALNKKLQQKYRIIEEKETRYESYRTDDAEIVIVAFGIVSRFSKAAVSLLRNEGFKVGLLRPITVFPFPTQIIRELAGRARAFLDIEMNEGQMVQDVKLAINGAAPVYFFGSGGGKYPTSLDIVAEVKRIYGGNKS